MSFFFFWLIFSVVVAIGASSRGRNGFAWFLVAALISPLIATILLALMPRLTDADKAPVVEAQPDRVKCPECAELILREAKVCKHCGFRLPPVDHVERPKPINVEPQKQEEVKPKLGFAVGLVVVVLIVLLGLSLMAPHA